MAERTHGSIEIEADPGAIMSVITDFEAYPDWASGVKTAKVLKRDAQKRGKQVHFSVSAGPVKADYTLEYTYKAKDTGVSWTFVEGNTIRSLEGDYLLAPLAKGRTKVDYKAAMEIAIPLPGFLKRQGERQLIDVALKGLKKRVESLG